ncbi:LAME_0F16820g1_1 [Lachancea meyersii CBS 8951]|uniref:chitinase n=1 Tax=Lachancea meyersii CBS 8951 TaxID=1266667 RepID=A0A1G4JZE4_9SACH|nr:LAME_0F16820g1_1 [Lachancea meyersii CBS 8951]
MKYCSVAFFIFFSVALVVGFDANSKSNVAAYWGQASAGYQQTLGSYCESPDVDVVLLSFLHSFPENLNLHFTPACSTSYDSGLLRCEQIANDIKKCQSLGKKVLLSMGGSSGSYGFRDDSQATEFATTLWNTFAGGSSSERPFNDAVIDGFDFDIENRNPTGYTALAKKLREYFSSANKQYYLSAAPQCFYPDASVGDLLDNVELDFVFIQFYNNACNVGAQFNWDVWVKQATSTPNSKAKLFLGLAGSPSAAASGYVSDLEKVRSTVNNISRGADFGGIMLWDASQGFANQVEGKSYVAQMKEILNTVQVTENDTQDTDRQEPNVESGTVTSTTSSTAARSASSSSVVTTTSKSGASRVLTSEGATTLNFLVGALRYTRRALF